MTILYIETNFLIAIAKGQDSQADLLISNTYPSVRIFIPNICYTEAVSVFKVDKQARLCFEDEMKKKIIQAKRDLSSNHAQSLCRNLEQAIIDNQSLLNDIKYRLSNAINFSVNGIDLEQNKLQNVCKSMLNEPEILLIKNDIIDNVILQSILDHAQLYPQEDKAFISNNSKDFGKPEVQNSLRNAGIKYFTMTQQFLDWFNSRSSS